MACLGIIVRLKPEEVAAIKESAAEAFGPEATVRLFGSRVDDTKRGGDIDLHVEISDREDWHTAKLTFQVGLTRRLGDRKIDVIVHRQGRELQPMDRIAMRDGVVL